MNSQCSNGFREFDSHTTTKIKLNNMKKVITIIIIAITIASCGSTYSTCPAFSNKCSNYTPNTNVNG